MQRATQLRTGLLALLLLGGTGCFMEGYDDYVEIVGADSGPDATRGVADASNKPQDGESPTEDADTESDASVSGDHDGSTLATQDGGAKSDGGNNSTDSGMDSGLDSGMDAAMDSGMDARGPDGGPSDAAGDGPGDGAPTDGSSDANRDSAVCLSEAGCQVSCTSSPCTHQCLANSLCDYTCGAGNTCSINCPSGSSCEINCENSAHCDVKCENGSKCNIQSTRGTDVPVECGDAAVCTKACSSNETVCNILCLSGFGRTCPGNVFVCSPICL